MFSQCPLSDYHRYTIPSHTGPFIVFGNVQGNSNNDPYQGGGFSDSLWGKGTEDIEMIHADVGSRFTEHSAREPI